MRRWLEVLLLCCAWSLTAEVAVKNGETIAFLGDSITDMGNWKPGGYLHLVADGLRREGIEITVLPAGHGGDRSTQMLARVETDVIAKHPDWMLLSCGVNDVWHGARGVPLPEYERNIRELVRKVRAAGIKVMILTPTLIYEEFESEPNRRLQPYLAFLKQLAAEEGLLLADLNTLMREEIAQYPAAQRKLERNVLTGDGVHMNAVGNQMMAEGILRAFGVPAERVKLARAQWDQLPDSMFFTVRAYLSADEFRALREKANREGLSTQKLLDREVKKLVGELLKK